MIYIGVTCYDGDAATVNLLQVTAITDTSHGHYALLNGGSRLRLTTASTTILREKMNELNEIAGLLQFRIFPTTVKAKDDGEKQQDTVD